MRNASVCARALAIQIAHARAPIRWKYHVHHPNSHRNAAEPRRSHPPTSPRAFRAQRRPPSPWRLHTPPARFHSPGGRSCRAGGRPLTLPAQPWSTQPQCRSRQIWISWPCWRPAGASSSPASAAGVPSAPPTRPPRALCCMVARCCQGAPWSRSSPLDLEMYTNVHGRLSAKMPSNASTLRSRRVQAPPGSPPPTQPSSSWPLV